MQATLRRIRHWILTAAAVVMVAAAMAITPAKPADAITVDVMICTITPEIPREGRDLDLYGFAQYYCTQTPDAVRYSVQMQFWRASENRWVSWGLAHVWTIPQKDVIMAQIKDCTYYVGNQRRWRTQAKATITKNDVTKSTTVNSDYRYFYC